MAWIELRKLMASCQKPALNYVQLLLIHILLFLLDLNLITVKLNK